MLRPHQTCETCGYWRAGASPDTGIAARRDSADEMGVCENIVPTVFLINGGPVTLQPTMHRTRRCAEWMPIADDAGDDPDGPDGPDGEPHPQRSRIRQLFPVTPISIAA